MNEHYSIKYYYIARIFFRWVFLCQILFAGVTGKVTGKVIDDNTGEALLGANIQIVGTYLGTSSDESGYFVILNIPPGAQTLRASMIGYSDVTVTGVRVEIDLTTEVDIQMKPEVIEGELIEVIAERKLVRLDVAASQKSISSNDIDQLPVSSVSDVISLQAGVSGFSVRGGSYNETMYAIDGIVMNDARTSEPTTGIPLSAIQDISVQTGGFGAEYRNVRSGVVNVVTKEGNPDSYSGTISFRNSPPTQKHFGISPYDKNSFWNRPYFDDDVCWTGTNNGNWDEYTQRQYPSFDGWNSVSQQTLADNDPINDLAPSGAQKLFTWENRKNGAISLPDYNIDAGFGGPLPLLSKKLGNLRFFASFRSEHDAYLYQVSRPGLNKVSSLIKLTSDLSKSMKLSFSYIAGELQATALSRGGGASYMNDVWDLASQVNMRGFTMPWRLFTDIYWSSSTVNNATTAMKLTHQLSHRSFYEVLVKFDEKNYHTWHGARRDTTRDNEILDGYYVDDSPEGFWGSPYFSVDGRLAFGGAVSTARDTSIIRSFTIKSDLTSQYNRTNQIKAGMEFVYNDLDLQFGSRNEFLPEGNYWTSMTQQPYRLSMYAQDKLEHQGFVAIAGLNLDFVDPNGEWYVLDVYDEQFYSSNYSPEQDDQYQKEKLKVDMSLSPRLAISHPITEVSKLYFNYGHYQQMPIAQDLYRIRRGNNNEVINMGDPVLPMAKTISYELGYDHAFKDMYLIHLSAYYKDILDQQDYTEYISANSKVIYYQLTSNSYEDIRGFELELAKIRGDWITGQVNYEYRVNTSGYFGVKKYFENPSEQRYYILKNPKQSKPRPTPRIKSVIDLHTPLQFGPKIAGQYLLGDWHINVLSYWRTGSWFTYNPNNVPGIEYNVQYKDNYSFDLKLAKSIQVGRVRLKLYADVYNVFNIKNFSGYGFEDGYDYNYYMQSLHMSDGAAGDLGYSNFTGKDKPGDVRDEGVDFVPMEWVANVESISTPSERPIYFDGATSAYMQWSQDNGWTEVNNNYYDEVINTKAYIDMPNLSHFVFLNPMDIFFGISLSYDF